MKKLYIFVSAMVAYFVICGYIITTGLHDIKVSSFKVGCMSVAEAPLHAIRQCESLAEDFASK